MNYEGIDKKVKIKCILHNIVFQQTPWCHLQGHNGCNICNKSKKSSKQQIDWLNFIEKMNNICIQHSENEKEYSIPETKYKADGYCKETNTIYEFHGDFWHGNPKLYNKDNLNPIISKTYGELYEKTLERERKIKELGYNLVVMWEYDWKRINKSIILIQRKFRNKIETK